jgi:hopene-associated glycosyltransferase HpnB
LLPASILVLLIWIYLTFLHARFWRIRRYQLPHQSSTERRSVAIVIPARNEANVVPRALSSLLLQNVAGELRIFLVDDNSSDGTGNAARAAAGILGLGNKLVVIRGKPLPPGWTGKVWAMHQGWDAAREMRPDYVLLTDADVEHAPDNLARLIAQAEQGSFDLVSVIVKLHCQTLAEKFLIPAFVYFFFLLYPPQRSSSPRSKIAGAAGGCLLVRTAALEKVKAFECIRSEIIDDCSLAARVKSSGGRLWLGLTQETRSIRGYGTVTNLRNIIARTAFNQLRHSSWLLAACLLGMLLVFVAPLGLVWTKDATAGWIAVAACVLMFTTYMPALRLYNVNSLSAVTLPLAAVFYVYATIYSAVNYWRGKGGGWKDRVQDPLPS